MKLLLVMMVFENVVIGVYLCGYMGVWCSIVWFNVYEEV